MPGHELAGTVAKVGKNVTKFKVGDRAGIGCIVDTCMGCECCERGDEQYCLKGMTMTYDYKTTHGHLKTHTDYTFGGYSESYTLNGKYLIKIPEGYPMESAGPIFCAGITTFSPLKYWGAINGGKKVGVIGIGGLGQMAVRLAKAMGNKVTAISTSPKKEAVAKEIGATDFVVSKDPESMKAAAGSLDLIIDTVSANHPVQDYLNLLKVDGVHVVLGLLTKPIEVSAFSLIPQRKTVAGSMIGGIAETQECIDFCAKHGIKPEIELITNEKLTSVYEGLIKGNDGITRYVLDINKSLGK